MTSFGMPVALAVSFSPMTSTSGISLPSASPVLADRANASMVMDSISFTNRCLSLPEIGALPTNKAFGSVPLASGIAVETGSPSEIADTEPQ
ncbi:hypothetical protein MCC10030_0559 [Bifidobacterium longum subsp. longum]|uniref:Uncharacterized protein n=1 Tax=Bifidobacterium longum subsp. longum TaxID=1679 RepID=A0A4R0SZA6_BIFLL|nr:hypothetical protein MCC10009_0556 [Bifidobacterium longum subsp. longum]TCE20454.1 hypothetical protein MCC10030_0559 [Bifidobacterium longum subsp. longum]